MIYLLSLAGGAGRNAVMYANALAEAGMDVTVVCGSTNDEGLERGLDPRVTFNHLGVTRSVLAIPGLARLLRRTRPAQALVIGPSSMADFQIAAALVGYRGTVDLRVATSPNGLLANYAPWKRALKTRIFANSLRRADRLIALTEAMSAELRESWAIPAGQITTIPNGVALPAKAERPPRDGPPVILCVARLQRQKDHDTLLRAFALLRAQRRCKLCLAGGGPLRAELERLAATLDIGSDVEFMGHVRDTAPLYRGAAITVLSSRYEGFGNVLIESLAFGTPIVATDCPTGPSEIINSDDVGLLCEMGNAAQLATCLDAALGRSYDPDVLRARAAVFSEELLSRRVKAFFCPSADHEPSLQGSTD